MKRQPRIFVLLCVSMLIFAVLGGCSLTGREQYRIDSRLYNSGSLVLGAAYAKGNISDAKWAKISGIMKEAKAHLSDAYKWIEENPNLADVPGYPVPALDPAGVAIGVVMGYVGALDIDLVPMEPPAKPAVFPATPPATQPGN